MRRKRLGTMPERSALDTMFKIGDWTVEPGITRRFERLWRKTLIAALGLLLGGSILWWATVPLE